MTAPWPGIFPWTNPGAVLERPGRGAGTTFCALKGDGGMLAAVQALDLTLGA